MHRRRLDFACSTSRKKSSCSATRLLFMLYSLFARDTGSLSSTIIFTFGNIRAIFLQLFREAM